MWLLGLFTCFFQHHCLQERLGSTLSGGVLRVVAAEHRSQWRNRQLALERLAQLLREA